MHPFEHVMPPREDLTNIIPLELNVIDLNYIEMMLEFCWNLNGILLDFCWMSNGILMELFQVSVRCLLDFYWNAYVFLIELYWISNRCMLDFYWNFYGIPFDFQKFL